MVNLELNGWKLEIVGDHINLPNGKVLKWNSKTRAWLEGLQGMWHLGASEGLADLIELSTGFNAFDIKN